MCIVVYRERMIGVEDELRVWGRGGGLVDEFWIYGLG